MTSDSTPRTFSGVGGTEWVPKKHSRIVYSGLVPISPYTTPTAVSVSGRSAPSEGRGGGGAGIGADSAASAMFASGEGPCENTPPGRTKASEPRRPTRQQQALRVIGI